jgi:hypothetical protein
MNNFEKSLELALDYANSYRQYEEALEKEHAPTDILDLEQKKQMAYDDYYNFLKYLIDNQVNLHRPFQL